MTAPDAQQAFILCVTPDGCTCGAPASTPQGMHHRDCAIRKPIAGDPA